MKRTTNFTHPKSKARHRARHWQGLRTLGMAAAALCLAATGCTEGSAIKKIKLRITAVFPVENFTGAQSDAAEAGINSSEKAVVINSVEQAASNYAVRQFLNFQFHSGASLDEALGQMNEYRQSGLLERFADKTMADGTRVAAYYGEGDFAVGDGDNFVAIDDGDKTDGDLAVPVSGAGDTDVVANETGGCPCIDGAVDVDAINKAYADIPEQKRRPIVERCNDQCKVAARNPSEAPSAVTSKPDVSPPTCDPNDAFCPGDGNPLIGAPCGQPGACTPPSGGTGGDGNYTCTCPENPHVGAPCTCSPAEGGNTTPPHNHYPPPSGPVSGPVSGPSTGGTSSATDPANPSNPTDDPPACIMLALVCGPGETEGTGPDGCPACVAGGSDPQDPTGCAQFVWRDDCKVVADPVTGCKVCEEADGITGTTGTEPTEPIDPPEGAGDGVAEPPAEGTGEGSSGGDGTGSGEPPSDELDCPEGERPDEPTGTFCAPTRPVGDCLEGGDRKPEWNDAGYWMMIC